MPLNLPHPLHLLGPPRERLPESAEGSCTPTPAPRRPAWVPHLPRCHRGHKRLGPPQPPGSPNKIVLLTLSAGQTAHEVPERVNRAAAKGYSLKCSGVRSRVGTRVLGGGTEEGCRRRRERRRKRGFQAGATLNHDAGVLQVDGWSGSGGKRPRGSPKHWQRGWQERIHSPASACRARRDSDRSSGGGGGAALSPPPKGFTDNKSWAEKR